MRIVKEIYISIQIDEDFFVVDNLVIIVMTILPNLDNWQGTGRIDSSVTVSSWSDSWEPGDFTNCGKVSQSVNTLSFTVTLTMY